MVPYNYSSSHVPQNELYQSVEKKERRLLNRLFHLYSCIETVIFTIQVGANADYQIVVGWVFDNYGMVPNQLNDDIKERGS